ncbi:MAG: hypothetical protein P8H59_09260 [Flavobacteriales bacterium]|nr:hypothetical protein [Flavobacteriales bacterium]MDG1781128.1 hypothetical protein [Flavobacteriales bacterium]MDG2247126.1 hypothetical protein [Flavobacteriales bacterium]
MKTLLLIITTVLTISLSAQIDVRMTRIDTDLQIVELTNYGSSTVDVGPFYLCNFPFYLQISNSTAIIGNTNLGPGQSVTVHWNQINPLDAELGIYAFNSFSNPNFMVDYVQWGSANHQREIVALGALLWVDDEFLTGGSPFTWIGPDGNIGESAWITTVSGCTYLQAENYDPDATVDNGICDFAGDPCPADFDDSQMVDAADLLFFLAAFGTGCN